MDIITSILTQLDVNSTIYTQLIIFIIFFVLVKFIFIDKLKTVLDSRGGELVKQDEKAVELEKMAREMELDYEQTLLKSRKEIEAKLDVKRNNLISEHAGIIKNQEIKTDEYINNQNKINQSEVQSMRANVMNQTNELSDLIIDRLK